MKIEGKIDIMCMNITFRSFCLQHQVDEISVTPAIVHCFATYWFARYLSFAFQLFVYVLAAFIGFCHRDPDSDAAMSSIEGNASSMQAERYSRSSSVTFRKKKKRRKTGTQHERKPLGGKGIPALTEDQGEVTDRISAVAVDFSPNTEKRDPNSQIDLTEISSKPVDVTVHSWNRGKAEKKRKSKKKKKKKKTKQELKNEAFYSTLDDSSSAKEQPREGSGWQSDDTSTERVGLMVTSVDLTDTAVLSKSTPKKVHRYFDEPLEETPLSSLRVNYYDLSVSVKPMDAHQMKEASNTLEGSETQISTSVVGEVSVSSSNHKKRCRESVECAVCGRSQKNIWQHSIHVHGQKYQSPHCVDQKDTEDSPDVMVDSDDSLHRQYIEDHLQAEGFLVTDPHTDSCESDIGDNDQPTSLSIEKSQAATKCSMKGKHRALISTFKSLRVP